MPRSNTGVFSVADAGFQPQTPIIASQVNDNDNDIATGLTQSLATTGVSTMKGQVILWVGGSGTPGLLFASDTTTGWFSSSANQWNYSASGVQIFVMNSNGITMTPGNGGNFLNTSLTPLFGLPPGVLCPFAGATVPSGWALCYGQAISRTTFGQLFTAIGTSFGSGDGISTFNLPDLRGRVCAGQDNMGTSGAANRLTNASTNGVDGSAVGNAGGVQSFTITVTTLPNATFTNSKTISVYGGTPVLIGTGGVTNCNQTGEFSFAFPQAVFTPTVTVSGTVGLGGSDTASNNVMPTLITNYIIFHGVFT